ncbi:Uncharacterised protein [Klebsiella pneumoniae]|nr:hypothetical protein AI2842V1_2106 [Klebsiella pneumoniae]CAH5278137.1 hypothetical protein AI2842V1_2106 [Klebsiella pneumoniae]SVV46305.1 Uncharacterised protein [Klebsiella pneumoniae]SYE85535.1 Uncharacterised protein [Klebsiella pneumoniae]VGH94281.1 Uncharacterised protein [Klebsiella pneumoniae]
MMTGTGFCTLVWLNCFATVQVIWRVHLVLSIGRVNTRPGSAIGVMNDISSVIRMNT